MSRMSQLAVALLCDERLYDLISHAPSRTDAFEVETKGGNRFHSFFPSFLLDFFFPIFFECWRGDARLSSSTKQPWSA